MIRESISELEVHTVVPLFLISSVSSHLQLLQFNTEEIQRWFSCTRAGQADTEIMDSQSFYGWKKPPSPSPEWTPPGPLNHTMKGMLMCSARAAQELDSITVGPSSSDYSVIL